jgi:hypothetical protein
VWLVNVNGQSLSEEVAVDVACGAELEFVQR